MKTVSSGMGSNPAKYGVQPVLRPRAFHGGLSRKQVTRRKATLRKGVRQAEIMGTGKHANTLLGYVIYDDKGRVWRFRTVRQRFMSGEASRTIEGATLMLCKYL